MHPDDWSDAKNITIWATSLGFNCLFKAWLSKISFLYFGVNQCFICLSVAIDPGTTELVLILYFPYSCAKDLVKPTTADFAVS